MSVRREILEPLRRTLAWQLGLRDGAGRIVCPLHKVEHTGKSACAAITAAELWRLTGEAGFLADALQQGRRLVANLAREGASDCHTFRPGRHDPYNCSNNVIDGGACSDALAHLVLLGGGQLDARDRRAFADASLLHARTYLRTAAVDKGVPAQRAWGLTGLAAAAALEPDGELDDAVARALDGLAAVQHDDGSFPYHPLDQGAEHAGASDVSAFYQSRVTAFAMFALERSGRDARDAGQRASLAKGLDFLLALQGPDGIKVGLVEAKPWYWGASYEVASHPFDVFALARGWRLFGEPACAAGAAAAFRAWVAHLTPDGEPQSHLPGPGRGRSFQCPLFWAAHACWIARAAEDLDAALELQRPPVDAPAPDGPRVTWFPQASLARLEDARVVAWVRGARPGFNVHHGSPRGAGCIRAVRKRDGTELLDHGRCAALVEGEWHGRRGLPSLARGLRSGAPELRFSLWLARVQQRAGRTGAALSEPLRVLRRGILSVAHPRLSSAFAVAPAVAVHEDGVTVTGRLSHADGSPLATSCFERTYRVDGEGLVVVERLLDPGGARAVRYAVPARAAEVVRHETTVRYRLA